MRRLIAISIATLAGVALANDVEAAPPVPALGAGEYDLGAIPLKQPACDQFGQCGYGRGHRHSGYHGHRGFHRGGYGGGYGGGYYPGYNVYQPAYYGGGYGYPPVYNPYRPRCGSYGGYGFGGSVNFRF